MKTGCVLVDWLDPINRFDMARVVLSRRCNRIACASFTLMCFACLLPTLLKGMRLHQFPPDPLVSFSPFEIALFCLGAVFLLLGVVVGHIGHCLEYPPSRFFVKKE